MENFHVKLADFGFARSCIDDKGKMLLSNTFCGSAAYAAPEILQVSINKCLFTTLIKSNIYRELIMNRKSMICGHWVVFYM